MPLVFFHFGWCGGGESVIQRLNPFQPSPLLPQNEWYHLQDYSCFVDWEMTFSGWKPTKSRRCFWQAFKAGSANNDRWITDTEVPNEGRDTLTAHLVATMIASRKLQSIASAASTFFLGCSYAFNYRLLTRSRINRQFVFNCSLGVWALDNFLDRLTKFLAGK
jgi:hypothetical protein